MRKINIFPSFTLFIILVLTPLSAIAHKCTEIPSVYKSKLQCDAILLGFVVDKEKLSKEKASIVFGKRWRPDYSRRYIVSLRVEEIWKGEEKKEFKIYTGEGWDEFRQVSACSTSSAAASG